MKKPQYDNYAGREVFIDVSVRVQPENEPPFESKMKVSLLKAYLLKAGVRVQVKYDSAKKEQVIMDDEPAVILERNPQLKKIEYHLYFETVCITRFFLSHFELFC